MPIRLATNCTHCQALSPANMCKVHEVKVSEEHTCDRFSLKPQLSTARQCTTCARYNTDSCPHPNKAAKGMLCASWAPQA